MTLTKCALALGAALLSACGSSSAPAPPPNQIGQVVPFTPPVDPDPATIPSVADGGGVLLYTGTNAQLVWKRPAPGPITAAAACTHWITSCVSPQRKLDDCARSVPTCATPQPWNEPACCPKSCFDRYSAARLAGVKDLDALLAVYLSKTDSCIPGLNGGAR